MNKVGIDTYILAAPTAGPEKLPKAKIKFTEVIVYQQVKSFTQCTHFWMFR